MSDSQVEFNLHGVSNLSLKLKWNIQVYQLFKFVTSKQTIQFQSHLFSFEKDAVA